jgi:hypothetical protein
LAGVLERVDRVLVALVPLGLVVAALVGALLTFGGRAAFALGLTT